MACAHSTSREISWPQPVLPGGVVPEGYALVSHVLLAPYAV
jgi:hypothetical protein